MSERTIAENVLVSIVASTTGDNVLVATQGSTRSIVVNSIAVFSRGTGSGQSVSFQESGTATGHFIRDYTAAGTEYNVYLGPGKYGWKLPKNLGLDLNLATNSTAGIAADIIYSVVDDI